MKKTFGQKLRELRTRKGKSFAEASIITGVLERSLRYYEDGANPPAIYKQEHIMRKLLEAK